MHRNMRFCAAVCPFLLLAALLLFLLCACGDSYPYMDTVAGETYRYRLSGNGYIQSVQVYDGERSRGTVRIRQSTRLEEPYENNGLVTGDFNGDGLEDFYVILSAREGVTDIACYLAKKNGGYTPATKSSPPCTTWWRTRRTAPCLPTARRKKRSRAERTAPPSATACIR